jgi:hypothetical protein
MRNLQKQGVSANLWGDSIQPWLLSLPWQYENPQSATYINLSNTEQQEIVAGTMIGLPIPITYAEDVEAQQTSYINLQKQGISANLWSDNVKPWSLTLPWQYENPTPMSYGNLSRNTGSFQNNQKEGVSADLWGDNVQPWLLSLPWQYENPVAATFTNLAKN